MLFYTIYELESVVDVFAKQGHNVSFISIYQ